MSIKSNELLQRLKANKKLKNAALVNVENKNEEEDLRQKMVSELMARFNSFAWIETRQEADLTVTDEADLREGLLSKLEDYGFKTLKQMNESFRDLDKKDDFITEVFDVLYVAVDDN